MEFEERFIVSHEGSQLMIYGDSEEDRESAGVPVLTRIEDARFKKIVRPSEILCAEVQLEDRLANARYMKATVRSEGKTVARLRFVLAHADGGSL